MARKIGRWLLFAVAAGCWRPGQTGLVRRAGSATAIARMDVVTTVLLLAGLPLLARRFLGPAINSRLARFLRAGGYAAILALMPALAIVEAFANLTPAQPAYRYVFCIAQGWSNVQGCTGVPGRSTGGRPGRARSRSY
jgi:hypothetical protein